MESYLPSKRYLQQAFVVGVLFVSCVLFIFPKLCWKILHTFTRIQERLRILNSLSQDAPLKGESSASTSFEVTNTEDILSRRPLRSHTPNFFLSYRNQKIPFKLNDEKSKNNDSLSKKDYNRDPKGSSAVERTITNADKKRKKIPEISSARIAPPTPTTAPISFPNLDNTKSFTNSSLTSAQLRGAQDLEYLECLQIDIKRQLAEEQKVKRKADLQKLFSIEPKVSS